MTLAARDDLIAALRAENDRLRDQVDFLKEALIDPSRLPPAMGLTRSEETIVRHLLLRQVGTRESIFSALYAGSLDEPDFKTVDTFVCKIRGKLRRFGIEIRTKWGEGYFFDADAKTTIRAMCDA